MNRTKEIIARIRRLAGNTSCKKSQAELYVIANELEFQSNTKGGNE